MSDLRKIRLDPEPSDWWSLNRMIHGGGWCGYAYHNRQSERLGHTSECSGRHIGLRLTLTTEDATDANDTAGP